MAAPTQSLQTRCGIAGGGPAGMMLAVLLARAGVDVLVLEKHADFSHLPTRCRFVAFMPQWDFLDFLVERGRRYPTFHVKMQAEVSGLIEEDGRVGGVRART